MSPTSREIRVLLADDHAVVRAGIRQFLQQAPGIQVVGEAEDGEQAMRLIESLAPDVAVLDVQMPKATGIEVARWARTKMKSVGILILTAYDDAPYVIAVLEAGAHGYMLKTAEPQEIIQAIRDVDEGKSALDIEVARRVLAQNLKREELGVQALTEREHEVLRLAARGYTNKAIGLQLGISDRTVQGHLAHIFAKLQAASRTEAVMRAVSLGWLTSQELAL
ncbi:MAG TPA: response regulator transcription factor [Anaerolineales bacterium]|nr:response regulator transcription factor [Anaerolineales bacterium]